MRSFVAFTVLALSLASGAPQQQFYTEQQQPAAAGRSNTGLAAARSVPIAIVRSVNNAPGTPGFDRSFDSTFESENGIKQEINGEMRLVDDSEVMVMRGSYSFVGDDSQTYVVDWYADETGFHPSAAHLPKSVEIPFPEQAEAVAAQIRFAEQEEAAASRSGSNNYDNAETRTAAASNNNYANAETRTAPVRNNNYQQAPQQKTATRTASARNNAYQQAAAPIAAAEIVQVRAPQQPYRTAAAAAPVATPFAAATPIEVVEVRAPEATDVYTTVVQPVAAPVARQQQQQRTSGYTF